MAEVELKSIVGRYGDFLAVDNIELTIKAGQFATLLGPSGCGKSSTLRIIAGLLKPTSGRVLFNGCDVTKLGAAARNIGMVFQSLALFPHMTILDNVRFGPKMKRFAPEARERDALRMLELVQLDHLAERYPAQLSGGQQQRVALARALAVQPSILILDEPLGALDRKLREAMQVELHALTRRLNLTTLFVTHDQEEALMLSDVIAVMNKGRIEQFGRPEEIYRTPQTQFVADFMGVTNFLSGTLVGTEAGRAVIDVAGNRLAGPHDARAIVGQSVSLAVRPERVEVYTEKPAPNGAAALGGTVRQVTFHGNCSRYVVDLGDGASVVALEPCDVREERIAPGTPIWTRWRPEDAQLFLR